MTSVVDEHANPVSACCRAEKTPKKWRSSTRVPSPRASTKAGLVDELGFEDQMWGELKDRSGRNLRVSMDKYSKITSESLGLQGKSRIAVVVGEGDILRGGRGRWLGRNQPDVLRVQQTAAAGGERFDGEGRGGAHRFAGRRGHRQ
jgi:hypothetical protein